MENSENTSLSGIEYLKKIGIKEVSERTFIHDGELEKFLDGDFQGINKTKVMGFIQILEREFAIDLDDLKNKYISYMNENQLEKQEPKHSLMMEEVEKEEKKRGFFSFIFLLVAIGSIAYLIDKYNLLDFTTPNDIKTARVVEDKDVKLNIEKLVKTDSSKVVKKAEKEKSMVSSEEANENLDNEEKQLSVNVNDNFANGGNSSIDTNKIIETKKNDTTELDLSKLNEDLYGDKNQQKQIDKNLEKQIDEHNETNQTGGGEVVTNEMYIIPKRKVWIGTIDLDTYKKKDFLAKKDKRVNKTYIK